MSNPDSRPYWQDQDNAGDAGWGASPHSPRPDESPWDDGGASFWRDDRTSGRSGNNGSAGGNGASRNGASRRGVTGRGARGRGASDPGGQGQSSWPEMLASRSKGGARRAADPRGDDWDSDRGHDRGGKFGQAADDLRSRLGMNGFAARRARGGSDGPRANGSNGSGPEEEFWSESAGRRGARGGDAGATRGLRRRATGPSAAYRGGPGSNGRSAYGEDGLTGSRTALRDHQNGFWGDGDRTGRMTGSSVGIRPGTGRRDGRRGGGNGSGDGGGNGGGNGGRRRGGGRPGDHPQRIRGSGFKNWLLYGSWWRRWTWKKLLLVVGGVAAAFVLLAIIGVGVAYSMTPVPTDVSREATWQSSSVYFSNGQLLGTFTNGQDVNRQLLTTSQMPRNVENAIIAAEDRNFYSEGGISVTGIMRAAYDDLFGSGGIQGGSTITEQYAKNFYSNIGTSRTVTTKIKEIFVAIKLAHSRSKPWILTNYLNTVPFGSNIYGVQAAAQDYFGVDLTKAGATLSTAQAAMLGAMPNNPAVFTPDPTAGIGYTLLVQRWQYVLGNMLRDRAISKTEADSLCASCALPAAEKAFNEYIHISESASGNGWTGTTGYLMQMVQQELMSTYHIQLAKIQTGGLRITTTFSPSMMRALTKAVNTEKQQLAAAGGARLPYYDHFGISLENPKTGGIIAIYGGPGYGAPNCLKLYCDYNMAEAPHPVGSSMKPYVLAAAINQGMDVQNSVLNGFSPLWIPPEYNAQYKAMLAVRGNPPGGAAQAKSLGWWESVGDASLGPLSVAKAAAQSSDPAFTDLAHHVGVTSIIHMAQEFGVGGNPFNLGSNDLQSLNALFGLHGHYSGSVQIALGEGNLTPIEQASTFATLMDNGIYHAPHVISRLTQWTPGGQQPIQLKIASHEVMSPAAAADEDYALSFDNINGTGYPNAVWPGRPVIGKTGTLGNGSTASEAWFVGAIPQYAMAVGLWTNTQAQNLDNLPSLGGIGGSFGGAWPAATWLTLMQAKFANLPVVQLPTPNYGGFNKWVLVAPQKPKKQACQQGGGNQGQNCNCNKRGRNCNPNPNPNPSPCNQPFGCGGGGPTPTPTPTPTVTPTCTPGPPPSCHGMNGPATTSGLGAQTTSYSALTVALSPAEENLMRRYAGVLLL